MGMFPVLILVGTHVKRTIVDAPQQHIRFADDKFTIRETHRRRTITATATLVEHQRPMSFAQLIDDLRCGLGDRYP